MKRTCIYKEIADRINKLRGIKTITVQQVIDVAEGIENTESHRHEAQAMSGLLVLHGSDAEPYQGHHQPALDHRGPDER